MPEPLAPGATIGILGGGQLGRMLAEAAARLGFRCLVYCEKADAPAFAVAAGHQIGGYDDTADVAGFAARCDILTYEFESIPAVSVQAASGKTPVFPGVRALEVIQDRLSEKDFLNSLGIATAPYAAVSGLADLKAAAGGTGLPAILKTRRFGYDGKGQARIDASSRFRDALDEIAGAPAILEGFVNFEKEISVVAMRGRTGEFGCYDIVENRHENHILAESRVPAGVRQGTGAEAADIARKIAAALDYVGVLAVELFYSPGEPLLVNELAPRVHNSGHWTLDACLCDQFENHIRAIAGWPLGPTLRHSDAVMTNLIGPDAGRWRELAAKDDVALHLYGKREARPGRKMGHFTRISPRKP